MFSYLLCYDIGMFLLIKNHNESYKNMLNFVISLKYLQCIQLSLVMILLV